MSEDKDLNQPDYVLDIYGRAVWLGDYIQAPGIREELVILEITTGRDRVLAIRKDWLEREVSGENSKTYQLPVKEIKLTKSNNLLGKPLDNIDPIEELGEIFYVRDRLGQKIRTGDMVNVNIQASIKVVQAIPETGCIFGFTKGQGNIYLLNGEITEVDKTKRKGDRDV